MLHPRQGHPLSVGDAPLAEALLSVESPESFDNNNSGVFCIHWGHHQLHWHVVKQKVEWSG